MDPGSAPGGILRRHGADEVAKLGGDSRPAGPVARKETPVPTEPARCQPTAVSGFTTFSTLAHLDQQRRRPGQKRRSHGPNFDLGFLRSRTPTCCPKAMSSSASSCRELKAPNQEGKPRRRQVMGPLYTTRSSRRRV